MAEREIHLRDYFAVVRKHDFIVVVSFILVFGSALIVSLYMPRMYEASAVIEVQPSTSPSGLSSLMQNVMSNGADRISMETICKRFTSRSLLAETIRNLKKRIPEIGSSLGTPDALAPKILAKIVPDTRMIEVTVTMRRDEGGSQQAARVTNELISVMRTRRSAKTNSEMERRQHFINNEIEAVRTQISDSDRDIREFLKNSGDALVWTARADYILTRLSDQIEFKEANEMILIAEKSKLDDLKARLAKEPEWIEYSRTFSRDPLWDKYRTDLAELSKQLAAARAEELGDKNPKVKSLDAMIREIEGKMRDRAYEIMPESAKTESRNPTHQALLNQRIDTELRLITYESRREMAEETLRKLNDEKEQIFSEMPEKQFQLDKMQREAEYKVDIYRLLLARDLEAKIWASENSDDNSGETKSGIEIVDVAQPGGRPVSPRSRFIGIVAGLAGLAVGLAMTFLADYFESTYQSPDEAKKDLGVPVLGAIPFTKGRQAGDSMLPVLESLMSIESESFRSLVTNIEFSSPETPHDALLITSSGAGEGKSFIAANLAVAMAQGMGIKSKDDGKNGEGKIILVDCDMRKANQHKIFGINNEVGLTNLLVGNADLESVIQDTNIPNLKLISCGPTPPNPVELLRSKRMDEVLTQLRDACDVLLCDSPPVLPVADALILASKLEGVLFVADLNHTPREVIRQAKEQLSKPDIALLGMICNRVSSAKHGSYYHYKFADQSSRLNC